MTINIAQIRQAADGHDLETVPMTRRMLRAIADELEAGRKVRAHVDWRERVNLVLRDIHQAHQQ